MSAASYHPRLVALLGFIGAAFLLIIGYSIGSIGGTEPLGPDGRTVAIITLSLTFGYNLGLATKQKTPGSIESIFYAWFFGSFVVLTGLGGVYTLWVSGYSLKQLFSARIFQDEMILVFGTLFGSIAIASGFIEAARIRFLKRAFTVFSEYVGQAILLVYASINVTGDITIGATLGGIVVVILAIATHIPKLKSFFSDRYGKPDKPDKRASPWHA